MSFVRVPIKLLGTERWGCLQSLDNGAHSFVGFDIWLKKDRYSFIGGHRVKLFGAKGNVHFRIPDATKTIDITDVAPAAPPPRRQGGR